MVDGSTLSSGAGRGDDSQKSLQGGGHDWLHQRRRVGHAGDLVTATVSTAIPVVMLTWIVMPNLTRLLDAGLYAGTGAIH